MGEHLSQKCHVNPGNGECPCRTHGGGRRCGRGQLRAGAQGRRHAGRMGGQQQESAHHPFGAYRGSRHRRGGHLCRGGEGGRLHRHLGRRRLRRKHAAGHRTGQHPSRALSLYTPLDGGHPGSHGYLLSCIGYRRRNRLPGNGERRHSDSHRPRLDGDSPSLRDGKRGRGQDILRLDQGRSRQRFGAGHGSC